MGKHSKPKSNLQKFMDSPFMTLVHVLAVAVLFGYVFAAAI